MLTAIDIAALATCFNAWLCVWIWRQAGQIRWLSAERAMLRERDGKRQKWINTAVRTLSKSGWRKRNAGSSAEAWYWQDTRSGLLAMASTRPEMQPLGSDPAEEVQAVHAAAICER